MHWPTHCTWKEGANYIAYLKIGEEEGGGGGLLTDLTTSWKENPTNCINISHTLGKLVQKPEVLSVYVS